VIHFATTRRVFPMPVSKAKRASSPFRLSKLVGFAITTQPAKAKVFYSELLGFRFVKDDGFALVFDAHGTMLRISKLKQFSPAQFTVLGWEVEDIEAAVAELARRGAVFERYPGMPQDKNAICTFPGEARVAWFKDPDGNVLSISEHNQ
jgi:predicted enzyme related to lactoylglutathione lyase